MDPVLAIERSPPWKAPRIIWGFQAAMSSGDITMRPTILSAVKLGAKRCTVSWKRSATNSFSVSQLRPAGNS